MSTDKKDERNRKKQETIDLNSGADRIYVQVPVMCILKVLILLTLISSS
jgi:hypothetical protein